MSTEPATVQYAAARPGHTQSAWRARGTTLLLGVVLVGAVYIAGCPSLDAPWIQGDEFIFIINNPDVNPDAAPNGNAAPLLSRMGRIFAEVHEDLYQPIPILTYALEWQWTGGNAASFRRTDLLMHALNAILLWRVLAIILAQVKGARDVPASLIAWGLALVWALHPMFVSTYASDMGRTHLLSATFALVALDWYVRALTGGRMHHFMGALAALVLAMLCKPIPGWLLLALGLEAARWGWPRAVLSWRLYLVATVSLVFAVTTLWTSRESGLAEDAAKGLFGDPLARSALAVWLYFRNLVAPFWIAGWYLPDPRTGWAYPLVWLGLLLALASVAHAVWSWRRVETRAYTLGWMWCWGPLLPVIGLVGARDAAAVDRYMYQPLMGVLLVVGAALVHGLASRPAAAPPRVVVAVAGILGLVLLVADRPLCAVTRDIIRRAQRVVRLNPGDPRALEGLAGAYDFARNHALPAADLAGVPPAAGQFAHFNTLFVETLKHAAGVPNLAQFFRGPADRGPFHRRLSYRFRMAGDAEDSLAQAQEALKLLPGEFGTWKSLAHAYQALQRYDDAVAAYQHCEGDEHSKGLLPADPLPRAVHYTDFANLLMFELERDAEACPRFVSAFKALQEFLTQHVDNVARVQGENVLRQTKTGLARCEIRFGEGAVGFQMISDVLQAEPWNVRAGLILAEYHLLSHHWKEAAALYEAIIHDEPTNYAALRGFHEVCVQTRRYRDAAAAWQDAVQHAPDRREFQAYLVWALALAAEDSAQPAAEELLEKDPNNPFACLALMLAACRAGALDQAVAWIARAKAGTPTPKAREFERAAATVLLMRSRDELPPAAVLAEVALYANGGFPPSQRSRAVELIEEFLSRFPDSPWKGLAEELRSKLSDVPPAP